MDTETPPPIEPTTVPEPAPLLARLGRRYRTFVGLAAFGAFLMAAVPVGLLVWLSNVFEGDLLVPAFCSVLVGSTFAGTAGLVAYLVVKPPGPTR